MSPWRRAKVPRTELDILWWYGMSIDWVGVKGLSQLSARWEALVSIGRTIRRVSVWSWVESWKQILFPLECEDVAGRSTMLQVNRPAQPGHRWDFAAGDILSRIKPPGRRQGCKEGCNEQPEAKMSERGERGERMHALATAVMPQLL